MKRRNVRYRQWEKYMRYLISLSHDTLVTPGLERHYTRIVKRHNRAQDKKQASSESEEA